MKTSYEEFEEIIPGMSDAGGFDTLFQRAINVFPSQDFKEAIYDRAVSYILSKVFNITDDYKVSINHKATFLSFLMMCRFYTTGKRKFSLDPVLVKLLMLTDFAKIPGDSIRLPFPCISINVGDYCNLELKGNIIRYIFITIYEKNEFNSSFVTRHGYKLEADRVLFIMAYAKAGSAMKTGRDDMFYWVIPFKDDEDIMDIVKKRLNLDDVESEFRESYFKILSFAMNSMLYITSASQMIEFIKPELKYTGNNPKKLRRLSKSIKDSGHYVINDKVIVTLKTQNIFEKGLAREERLSMRGRWIVRGHWRNQPCGPSLSLRKLTWIHPFYKGNDISDVIDKNYEVKL